MYDLTVIKKNGGCYIDSREVAEVIGKPHNDLMKAIRRYCDYLNAGNFSLVDFFVSSAYIDGKGETRPCYLLSKMGCEMVANKLTGEKGVLFTAAYVSKFNEMERRERAELEALAATPTPRLGEINSCVRNIIRGLKYIGAPPEQIMEFLKETYKPYGITVDTGKNNALKQRWYRASDIARALGLYSLYGKPHSQAVSCILNEKVFIEAEHKRLETEHCCNYDSVSVFYGDYALDVAWLWLVENGLPDDICGSERTYHVKYWQ